MTPPDDLDPHQTPQAENDAMHLLAVAMERMAGEMASLKTRLERSESLLEAIANRMAVLASHSRPQPVTKEDLKPVLTGLLHYLEREARPANDSSRGPP